MPRLDNLADLRRKVEILSRFIYVKNNYHSLILVCLLDDLEFNPSYKFMGTGGTKPSGNPNISKCAENHGMGTHSLNNWYKDREKIREKLTAMELQEASLLQGPTPVKKPAGRRGRKADPKPEPEHQHS